MLGLNPGCGRANERHATAAGKSTAGKHELTARRVTRSNADTEDFDDLADHLGFRCDSAEPEPECALACTSRTTLDRRFYRDSHAPGSAASAWTTGANVPAARSARDTPSKMVRRLARAAIQTTGSWAAAPEYVSSSGRKSRIVSSGPSIARRTAAMEIPFAGRARRAPPSDPRRSSTRPARRNSARIWCRKWLEMPCAVAISLALVHSWDRRSSAPASSAIARTA